MRWEGQECVRCESSRQSRDVSAAEVTRAEVTRAEVTRVRVIVRESRIGEWPVQTGLGKAGEKSPERPSKAAASGHLLIRALCGHRLTPMNHRSEYRGAWMQLSGEISHQADSTAPCKRGTSRATG